MTALFGPSGNSQSFYDEGHKSTTEAPEWLKKRGLDAFEYSFGRGVRIREGTAREIGNAFVKEGITLSVHAPYYINLASTDEKKKKNTIRYFTESVTAAHWMGATRVIFHPGAVGKEERETAFGRALEFFSEIIHEVESLGYEEVRLCPETLGKINQLGSVEEVLRLCSLNRNVIPAIDFGHLHARTVGGIKSKDDYKRILDMMEEGLADERARKFHVHFSHIEYTKQGEKKHCDFKDEGFGPDFEPFAELMVERNLGPTIICESPTMMAEDARTMKDIYLKIKKAV
ncbi:TIM barrel protein [Calorimonas adulescens]|uniref:TIM barrel protein n=1 Tax=Calorimonas adulescens TaxID=2606906 RepID=A0A5D8QFJ3_9THEO|nr:TIM barrel protein [Calorimonas adulescens]TZE83460.1 TIM barrel protein [Calorimonas adulescens]